MSPRPTPASAAALRQTAERIAEQRFDMLRGVAYNAGARGEQIEEAVQQGFAALLSSFPGDPDDLAGVRRYLVRCIQSAAWKILRTNWRRWRWMADQVERDRLDTRAGDAPWAEGVDLAEPVERVLAYEALDGARHLLQQLPDEWVAVLLLGAAGFGTAEIAQRLGLSERQVRKRVQKAHARLDDLTG